MAYPFLPVNPCCTDVVLNTPCGCSSVMTTSGCNSNDPCSTQLTASSTIVYDGVALPCIVAEPCDTLNVILQKIDEIICNLQTQINYLTNQVTNITNQVININGDIINIYNTLDGCCSATTTSTSTTVRPCENFSLNNTGDDPVAIIITDCTTQEQEAIVLMPGDTNICVITNSPLTVPGTVIVTPNGPCAPLTTTTTSSSTTSTTSTSSTTTTTTTAIPCECLTFTNTDDVSHLFSYTNCLGEFANTNEIAANETIQVCGCCGLADSISVTITIGANCIDNECPVPITTTTTTTAPSCNCFDSEINVSSEILASTDNNKVTVLYNDCFGNPYINTYDASGIYKLGCVDYSVDITIIGLIDDVEQILYVPIRTGVPCCGVIPTTTTTTTAAELYCTEISIDVSTNCPDQDYALVQYTDCEGNVQTVETNSGELLTFCMLNYPPPVYLCGTGGFQYGEACSTTTTTTTLSVECDIAFANSINRLWVTNGSPTTFIEFDSLVNIPQSPSIAITLNKLFVLVNEDNLLQPVRKIYEYDMSYSPNSLTFVREIDYPVGVNSLGNGACALSNTMLVVPVPQCTPDYAVCPDATPIVRLDISGSVAVIDSTITYLPMFNATTPTGVPTGNFYSNLITGDIIYTTNNKIITLDQNSTWPLVNYIHQYDAITGNLEFELVLDTPLSPTVPRLEGSVGIFVFNSNLHLVTNTNPITGAGTYSYIYQVDLTSPYNITSLGQASPLLIYADASTSAGCVNVSFTPNITTTTTTLAPLCELPDIVIGTQTWTVCNLNVDRYRNGDPIPQATNPSEWENLTTGAWCYYNFDPANGPIYGKLYNWYAVNDPRGLAPIGYHIPTLAELATLSSYLGTGAGGKLKEAGLAHWTSPNTGATNATGFTGLPGGYVSYSGYFYNINDYGYIWALEEYSSVLGNYYRLDYNNDAFSLNGIRKDSGISVRLVKDPSITTTTTTLAPTGFNTIYTHFESL